MNGYQITFFTVHGHRHKGKPVGDWLVQVAKEKGLSGATLIAGAEGFGHHRRMHSAHFIELTDQPLEVVMILSTEESERLFAPEPRRRASFLRQDCRGVRHDWLRSGFSAGRGVGSSARGGRSARASPPC
jgi:PII-like signaling protein